jgi:hypothetical protein
VNFLAWPIERIEKPKPLDVIQMEMRKQEVDARYFRPQSFP